MNRILLCVLLMIPALGLAQAPASVETDMVTRANMAATLSASGVVVSLQDAAIATELEGRLKWIAAVGDRVREGDIIAQLDKHMLELDKRDREAEIAALKANLEWLERQTQRLNELANANNTAHSELDETRARYLVLQQELAQAQVGLERTRYNLERTAVRAPFDGVVVSREMAAGEYAAVGWPLLRLVNTNAAEISVNAPLRLARYSEPGDAVKLSNGDQVSHATVRSLIAVGDLRSHMMEIRLTPETAQWLIGEAVTVELPASDREDQTTVSRDAVVLRDRSNYVFVVGEDLTAKRIDVRLGPGQGERIAVSGELAPGDKVVIRGAENLRDGQKVAPLSSRITMR